MLAVKQEAVTNSFLGFASEASNILHIKTEEHYQEALSVVENLFEKASDSADDPLNDLIEILARAIEKYELHQEALASFVREADSLNPEISVLKVLINQHNLTVSDLKEEIGSKSLVSMILNGKRNLTKDHIYKLAQRFNINPAIFFNLKAV
ncbi:MAG: helix-turn-helix domain-containing protein [Gammaproteobacteria bacterium]